jgi:hypothetical protein
LRCFQSPYPPSPLDVDLIPRDFEKLLHISHIEIHYQIPVHPVVLTDDTLDTIFPNVP